MPYIGSNEGKNAIGNHVLVDGLKGVVIGEDPLRNHLNEIIVKLEPNQQYKDPRTYTPAVTGENSYTSTQNTKWDPEYFQSEGDKECQEGEIYLGTFGDHRYDLNEHLQTLRKGKQRSFRIDNIVYDMFVQKSELDNSRIKIK